jgi:hypothetical protein
MPLAPHLHWREVLKKPLVLLALFALVWAVVRACVQAVVIDEAETFEVFSGRPIPSHWDPASNNHVLSSLLIRLSTLMLGPSHVSLRLPALFGALFYICAAYWLAQALSGETRVRIPVFLCLVYNPLVFDFFTVGRGYSLALAGLLGALALGLWGERQRLKGENFPLNRVVSFASASLGVSFSANFSFAFIDFAALGLLAIWAFRIGPRKVRAVTAAIVPMFAVTVFFCSWTLLHWPAGQLWDGAASLAETFQSVARASLYQLNPYIVNPLLFPWLQKIQQNFLLPAVGIVMAVQLVFCLVRRRDAESRWLWTVAGAAVIPLVISLAVHRAAHGFFGLLLPRGRTAIYFVPLVTLFLCALTAIPAMSPWAKRTRMLALAGLWALAGSYVLSLRLTYTQEWLYLAEVKDVYWQLVYLSKTHHVHEVFSSWRYGASLNFYRRRYGGEAFNEVSSTGPFPRGKHAYVLFGPTDESYAVFNRLQIAYRGAESGILIAVDPAVDPAFYGVPPVTQSAAETGTIYDDISDRIEFSGHWFRDTQFQAASNGTLTYSNIPGDKFRFLFQGVSATLIYTKAFNRGIAEVLLDGGPAIPLDMYSPDVQFQHRTEFGPVKAGAHVIEVRVAASKNGQSTDHVVDLDAIEVR